MAISDIMISPARLLSAPLGTTLPADSLALEAAWPAGWLDVGYTAAPLSVEYTYEKTKKEIQESISLVGAKKSAESLKLETTLAEFTLDNIAHAWGGVVTETPAGAGQVGKEEISGGDNTSIDQRMYGFEGSWEDDEGTLWPIRFIIFKGGVEVGGKLEFGKAVQTGIPLKIEAYADMTKSRGARLFKIVRILEEALS